jgi:hypothetical protein
LEDPRTGNNTAHSLENVLTIAILAVICGADGWVDVERYDKAKKRLVEHISQSGKGYPLA